MATDLNKQSTLWTDPRALVERALGLIGLALGSRLFLLTTLNAIDGQIAVMAAAQRLADPGMVLTVGLTMIGGVGSMTVAMQEADLTHARGRRVFAVTAVASTLVNTLAVVAGVALASRIQLEAMPYFAALALVVIAVEVWRGERVHVPGGFPVPAVVIVLGVVAEVWV